MADGWSPWAAAFWSLNLDLASCTRRICQLADLTLHVPRRRRWWDAVAGLGPVGARHIEAFFAQHPELTERARALVTANRPR